MFLGCHGTHPGFPAALAPKTAFSHTSQIHFVRLSLCAWLSMVRMSKYCFFLLISAGYRGNSRFCLRSYQMATWNLIPQHLNRSTIPP